MRQGPRDIGVGAQASFATSRFYTLFSANDVLQTAILMLSHSHLPPIILRTKLDKKL